MNYKKRYLKRTALYILLLLVSCLNGLLGQEKLPVSNTDTCRKNQVERIYVQLPQHTLVAGQPLYLKAYLFNTDNNPFKDPSSVVYFDIISANGKAVARWRSYLDSCVYSGKREISDTIRTGKYVLRAYTNWMLNYGSEFVFQTPLFISNINEKNTSEFLVATNKKKSVAGREPVFNSPISGRSLTITGLKEDYRTGQEILVTIHNNDTNSFDASGYSCAITRLYSIDSLSLDPTFEDYYSLCNQLPAEKELCFAKESDAWLLSGKLLYKANQAPVCKETISLSVKSAVPQIRFTQTNEKGDFYFWIEKTYNNKDLLLKVVNDSVNSNALLWKTYSNYLPELKSNSGPVTLESKYSDDLEEIEKLYLIDKYYSLPAKGGEDSLLVESCFQYEPDYVRRPSDYNGLESFLDIVKNILPLVSVSEIDNKPVFVIQNTDRNGILKDPLVLVDGIVFDDMHALMQFDPENIDAICVYKSKIFYGDYAFAGIISITTKENTDASEKALKNTHRVRNLFERSDVNIITEKSVEKKPRFGRLLYWNPELDFNDNNQFSIRIPASALSGNYKLIIEGLNGYGKPVTIEKYIRIEE